MYMTVQVIWNYIVRIGPENRFSLAASLCNSSREKALRSNGDSVGSDKPADDMRARLTAEKPLWRFLAD